MAFLGYAGQEHLQAFANGCQSEIFRAYFFQRQEEHFCGIVHCLEMQGIRYRTAEKKTELCHTLNGSALALPRIVAALLENNQTPEGIRIPKALVPYTGFEMID